MKEIYKRLAWIIGALVLLGICVLGCLWFKGVFNPEFKETRIYPDESRIAPADTTINVNGMPIKMIGVKGGKIDCKGLKETVELDDFYISETEVTQELWQAIMGDNPSVHNAGGSMPVENIDLVDCLDFVHKLDSVTGYKFEIPSYPQWLYVVHLGTQQKAIDSIAGFAWYKDNAEDSTHNVKQKNPNDLGVYDMLGNVAEWTISGSDPLFIVAGGSFRDETEKMDADYREFDHVKVKLESLGLRLVSYPGNQVF